jgi:hypothetical protein
LTRKAEALVRQWASGSIYARHSRVRNCMSQNNIEI